MQRAFVNTLIWSGIGLLNSLIVAGIASATESAMPFRPRPHDHGALASATVYLVPPSILYRTRLDEAAMQRQGCAFITKDRRKLSGLAGLLETHLGDAAQDRGADAAIDARQGIYLSYLDGTKATIILDESTDGREPVRGRAGESGITGEPMLPGLLRQWSRDLASVPGQANCAALYR